MFTFTNNTYILYFQNLIFINGIKIAISKKKYNKFKIKIIIIKGIILLSKVPKKKK